MPRVSQEQQTDTEDLNWFELSRIARPLEKDVIATLSHDLVAFLDERVISGSRVGLAVGSRGIARIAEVVAAVITVLRARGDTPVVIPAMGSHGGATDAGQLEVLHELGIDMEALDVSVDASMEVEEIGRVRGGQEVYVAASGLRCDCVIPINRVKPHTEFRAPIESGLTKMLAIGLGKQRGASSLHSAGFEAFDEVLPEAAGLVLGRLRVPFGIALVEDAWHRLEHAEVIPAELIFERDRILLSQAWQSFARLPFEQVDVLLLREMGKTISGTGMDPNVTGRFPSKGLTAAIEVARLVVLDLVAASGGNAVGMGLADVVTERLRSKVDWGATYANVLASRALVNAKLPLVAESDEAALSIALSSLTRAPGDPRRLVAMANTLDVNHIAVSESLVSTATAAGYELVGSGLRAEFRRGSLRRIGGLDFFAEDDDDPEAP